MPDLLYKVGAVLYHEKDAFFPVYGYHSWSFSQALAPRRVADEESSRERRALSEESISARRAAAVFERIEREYPDYAGRDRAIFSQGLAWRRISCRMRSSSASSSV